MPDPQQEAQCIEGARLFGTAASMILFELDAASLYDTAVEAQGKVFVTTELGGGGTSRAETVRIAKRGVLLSVLLPYLLILTSFIGGAYLILDATAGERERQSLEPLLATPAPRRVKPACSRA